MKYYTGDVFFSIYFHGKYYIYKIMSAEKESNEANLDVSEEVKE